MRMGWGRLAGLIGVMLLGLPQPAAALTTMLSHEGESIIIEWPDDENWVVGFENDEASFGILETVREPETVENWTELGMLRVFRDESLTSSRADIHAISHNWFEETKKIAQGASLDHLGTAQFGPYIGELFTLIGKNYDDGTSETQVHLLVQGSKALYSIQRVKRTAVLAPELVLQWAEFLKTARIVMEQSN